MCLHPERHHISNQENTMKANTTQKLSLQLSLLTLTIFATPWAQADENTSWYMGASAGPTQARIDDAHILQNLGTVGLGNASISDADRDNGYKVFGGYQFNRNFALEGSYFDLGKFGFSATTTPPGTLNGDISLRGFGLDAVLSAPLTSKLRVFAKLGANYAEARDNFNSTGAVTVLDPNPSKTELNPKIGIGVQYTLTEALSVRAELERYRVNDAVGGHGDVDHLSIGLVYSWGFAKPPMPVPAPEPVAVVEVLPVVVVLVEPPPAPPPPVPTPPPPAPKPVVIVPTKISLSADSLFAFDKSTVSPDGKQQLDAFAAKLKGLDYEFITVTGHTDRLGEHVYNVKLSERRALVVGAYLTDVAGITADKVLARGQNGSDPVTQPGDCVGTKVTNVLIACLQPDRRVDLEVTGTR
jgi:OOP family OmpA-OmpF porin